MNRNYGKWFLTPVKKTIINYRMIKEGDRVALGVSGGKDSIALLFIMALVRKHAPFSFDLQAIFVDMGWEVDLFPLEKLCSNLEIPFHVEKTVISKIVFERRKEKNPCSLCSKLRRGALHKAAVALNCNSVALGHHLDDVIQTYFLNILYSGRMDTFKPHTYLSRRQLNLIRPLIGLTERTVSALVRREGLPTIANPCPLAGKTERKAMGEIVDFMVSRYPGTYKRFATAFEKSGIWTKEVFRVED